MKNMSNSSRSFTRYQDGTAGEKGRAKQIANKQNEIYVKHTDSLIF